MPTMVHFTPLLFLALSLFSVSYSNDFSVDVGKVDLNYTPDHVLGAVAGDTITFNFFPANVTVTQSSFTDPCTKLTGGIDSGFRSGSPSGTRGAFTITVNHSDAIWIHCEQIGHCTSGMVFAINPDNAAQLAQFKANAARSAIVSVPPGASPNTHTAETTASGFDYSHNPVASPNSASRYAHSSSLYLVLLVVVSFVGLLM